MSEGFFSEVTKENEVCRRVYGRIVSPERFDEIHLSERVGTVTSGAQCWTEKYTNKKMTQMGRWCTGTLHPEVETNLLDVYYRWVFYKHFTYLYSSLSLVINPINKSYVDPTHSSNLVHSSILILHYEFIRATNHWSYTMFLGI